MQSPLDSIIIHARDMQKSAAFYSPHLGFFTNGAVSEGLVELNPPGGGAAILIHQAATSVKLGQVGVKLSDLVEDVAAFFAKAAARGLPFRAIHQANGYSFANAKGPDGNLVNALSRAYRV